MTITVDRLTKIISVPQADLTPVSGTLYEMDTNWFHLQLKAIEASEEGMAELDMHDHITSYAVAGVTYARKVEIINGYSVEFTPDSQWSVRLAGSNNNIFDVESGILEQNQVQVIAQNSAGLVVVPGISKPGNIRTELIEAVSQNATRKVEIGSLDRIVITYKDDAASDWSAPIDTQILYAWYDTLGDTNPIITGESD